MNDKYKIVWAESSSELEEKVNEAMKNGYSLAGGCFVIHGNTSFSGKWWYQAIVKN